VTGVSTSSPRTAAAALVLGVLVLPVPTAAAVPEARLVGAEPNPCAGTKAVRTAALKTPDGVFLGKAKITYDAEGGDDATACAVVQVAKKYRRSANTVSRSFRKLSDEGEVVDRLGTVEPADDLFPMAFSSSYTPADYSFVLKAKIDIGTEGKATLTYVVK
jgi:hypothetical protein